MGANNAVADGGMASTDQGWSVFIGSRVEAALLLMIVLQRNG